MSQREVAVVGKNNTRVKVTGQEELVTKVSMLGSPTFVLNNASPVTGEFESIVVLEDTIFNTISLDSVVDVKSSLIANSAIAVKAGAIIAWGGGQYFTTVRLTSGSVLLVKR